MTIEELFEGHESSVKKYRDEWKTDDSILNGYHLIWAQRYMKRNQGEYRDKESDILYDQISRKICDRTSKDEIYSDSMDFLHCIDEEKNIELFINKNKSYRLYSSEFETDDKMGMCMDGDGHAVRYINLEKDKAFKMKAGKFIKHIIDDYMKVTGFTITDELSRYIQERFSAEWKATHNFINDKVELVVDCNFEGIYDNDECDGDFGSCMSGEGQWRFYENAILANAAYIKNIETGLIMARCILYNTVHEKGTNNIYRLAERQYSKNGDLYLKQVLIDKLIEAGRIDGYKRVGASYNDNRDFVAIDGTSMEDKVFYLSMDLNDGDTLSYQDSFKFFDEREGIAYNSEDQPYSARLDKCSPEFECETIEYWYWDGDGYSSDTSTRDWINDNCALINEEYFRDYAEYNEECYRFDDDNIVWVDGEYHHINETVVVNGETCLKEDCVEVNGEWYFEDDSRICVDFFGGYILLDESITTETGEVLHKDNKNRYIEICGRFFYVGGDGVVRGGISFIKSSLEENIDLEELGLVQTKDGCLTLKTHAIQIGEYYINENELNAYYDEYVRYSLGQLKGFNDFCKKNENEKVTEEAV